MESIPKKLEKALMHNKFGSYCLKGEKPDLALKHFFLALEEIRNENFFTNIYQNIGNSYAMKRDYDKASEFYNKVLEFSPYNEENIVKCEENSFEIDRFSFLFHKLLNAKQAFIDAHVNCAVMEMYNDNAERAMELCLKAIELDDKNNDAYVNLIDLMRQVNKKEESIELAWSLISKAISLDSFKIPEKIEVEKLKIQNNMEEKIKILTVKWGTRYSSEYVNKLFNGFKRYSSFPFEFLCLTDDGKDLNPEINARELKENWSGWWGKSTLFSPEISEIKGRKFYIDLDMIITGNVDDLFAFDKSFGILRTDEIACEKSHKGGFNSSIMIWNTNELSTIYSLLKSHYDSIRKYIVRFDYWLEMNISQAYFLQEVFPGQLVDYKMECIKELPKNARIVSFPRTPKPEDYPSEWIRQYWI